MGLLHRKNKNTRHAKPVAGRSLSSNSYYRPATRPFQDEKAHKKQTDESLKNRTNTDGKQKFTFTRVVNGLLVAVFVLLALFATTMTSTPVVRLADNSYPYRDVQEYTTKASELLKSNILQRSKLFFRSVTFENEMVSSFPEIATIDAIVPLGGRDLSIAIGLSEPLAEIYNGGNSGVLDTQGVLVSDVTNRNDLYRIRLASPQDSFQVGSRILTVDEVNLLRLVEAEFIKTGMKSTPQLTIKEVLFNVSQGQFEISFNQSPYFLRASTYADPREQVGAALSTLRELDRAGTLPEKYIDVRVPGRVFVQ